MNNTHCRSTIESPPTSQLLWTVWPAAEFPVLESIQAELDPQAKRDVYVDYRDALRKLYLKALF